MFLLLIYRIVIVSSRLSDKGKINFDDLMLEKEDPKTSKVNPYSNSKLANLHFAKELSNRLEGTNVNVYALCPGWVKTDLARYMDLTWKQYIVMIPVAFVFMRTPRQVNILLLHSMLTLSTLKCQTKKYNSIYGSREFKQFFIVRYHQKSKMKADTFIETVNIGPPSQKLLRKPQRNCGKLVKVW